MKKILKRGASLLLAFCLVLGGLALVPQKAAALAVYTDFADLAGSPPWYANYLNQSFLEGFFYGTSVNTFEPDRAITRGEAVTVLGRVHERLSGSVLLQASEQPYEDVQLGRYYTKYIAWAKENDLLMSWMLGREETLFAPSEEITQNQLAGLLDWYIDQLIEGQFVLAVPEDSWLGRAIAARAAAAEEDHELVEPAITADEEARGTVGRLGIIEESHFAPESKVLRGESSAFFVRLYQTLTRIEDRETPYQRFLFTASAGADSESYAFVPMTAPLGNGIVRGWKLLTSQEEYDRMLHDLGRAGANTDFDAPVPGWSPFADRNLLVVEFYTAGSPKFAAGLSEFWQEANPVEELNEETGEIETSNVGYAKADFNISGYLGGSGTGDVKGEVYCFAVPKDVDLRGVTLTFHIQAEDNQPIGVTAGTK